MRFFCRMRLVLFLRIQILVPEHQELKIQSSLNEDLIVQWEQLTINGENSANSILSHIRMIMLQALSDRRH